jgi:hypothetical protein
MRTKTAFNVDIATRVIIRDSKTKEVLVDKSNAIHNSNMARALARGLAKEPNGFIYRMAFGNGGTFTDAAGNIVIRPPNDGNNGDGWESRLYNETYSEVVDDGEYVDCSLVPNPLLGTNPISGGSVPSDDPSDVTGVVSQEVGTKSNVIITVFLNENEPTGQLSNSSISSPTGEERQFYFDEIGLYTFGKPPQATNGRSSVNVGNKTSTDELTVPPSLVLNISANVGMLDGSVELFESEITIPAGGTGPGGQITFGDFCEGFNSGAWITNGDPINSVLYAFITDRSGGEYPSIIGKESFGFLTFENKTTGSTSSVELICNDLIASNFFNVLTSGICGNVNVNQINGEDAGVQNDPTAPCNERERLLTHLIFNPILKAADRAIDIEYTLTISVQPSQDSSITQNFVG